MTITLGFQLAFGLSGFRTSAVFPMPLPPEVAKGDDRLSGEVIALNKGIDDRRCDVPPDRKADINNVIFVHTVKALRNFRTRSRVVHLDAAAAVAVVPVEICTHVGDGRLDLKEVGAHGFGQTLAAFRVVAMAEK